MKIYFVRFWCYLFYSRVCYVVECSFHNRYQQSIESKGQSYSKQLFWYFYQFTTVFHSREQGGPAAWLHAHAILLKELSSDQPKVHSRLKNQLHTVQLFTIGVIKLITTVDTKKSSSFQHPGDKLVQLKFHTKTTLT